MSRETDSSSSGPQGRGGAAYPSGTPPYGTRQYPSLHPQEDPLGGGDGPAGSGAAAESAGAAERRPDGPKTETTLTTRIRINIPGSRPIPPVVVRTPVTEGKDGSAKSQGSAGAAGEVPSADSGQAPAPWPPPGVGSAGAAGAASAGAAAGMAAAEAGAPGGGTEKPPASDWFAPRKPPSASGSSGSAASSGAVGESGGPSSGGMPSATGGPGAGVPRQPNIPYLNGNAGVPHPAGPVEQEAPSRTAPPWPPETGPSSDQEQGPVAGPPAGSVPFPTQTSPAAGQEPPAGPTVGPMTGGLRTPTESPRPGYRPPSGGTGSFRPLSDAAADAPAAAPGPLGSPGVPGVPGAPAAPRMFDMPGPTPEVPNASAASSMSSAADDGPGAHVSGDTLISGVRTVPPPGANPLTPQAAGSASSSRRGVGAKPASKGRSKLVLAGAGLVGVLAVAYGAGLLMDHADVPNGTVVLGTNIGGKSKDDAVKALDAAMGNRATAPLQIEVGNQSKQLDPQLAGLGIDTDETVREVAHRDYNPISVISSLFGGTHDVAPAITVDQDKLGSALQTLTAGTGSGSGSDGMVKFVDGKPVAVPGRPYQAVDPNSAAQKITAEYTQRAETGQNQPVPLQVTVQQPKVTQAALEKAIMTIGDPAMSGRITVVAGTKEVPFSPQKSLSKILTIVPDAQGQLTLHFDLQVLQQLYGNSFDGVLLVRGDGSKTPVTPQDVASAMMPELRKTAATKIATIPNVAK
ncbi:hypothetical protein NGB36_06185 [Streptomyces sp. RB6PN25]|uniref:Peptidoglycan binding domain-containing protein n=1 Tax=Streptomyces humicola TaxID=2953240 RepID=A0ABT1PR96_9ACTN|nr:hypothetical protein [Streptomyces humicola]MCQ4080193.1 hypothetical protein [Streptomyces humicola]